MKTEDKNADFKSYPTRGITLADEVWKEFKAEKNKFGKNWTTFIKELLERYKNGK